MAQHSHPILHLRHSELNPELAAKLAPFLIAYRPHDDIPTREDMDRINTSGHCNIKELTQDIGLDYSEEIKDRA